MDIKPRRKRCEKGGLRRKTEKRKCYPQEISEDKMLITFCPQMYHLLWIKFFLISAHLPTLSKKPITGVGVKSNFFPFIMENFEIILLHIRFLRSIIPSLTVAEKINARIPCKLGVLAFYAS